MLRSSVIPPQIIAQISGRGVFEVAELNAAFYPSRKRENEI